MDFWQFLNSHCVLLSKQNKKHLSKNNYYELLMALKWPLWTSISFTCNGHHENSTSLQWPP
jgi:hypothetical protein